MSQPRKTRFSTQALATPALLAAALMQTAAGELPRQPADAPITQHLAVDGGRIAYDDTGGSGPLVIAVPGMGDLRSEYRALRPLLQRAGYRVVTMDVRGFGESSAQWRDLSARAVGGDVLRLVEHLDAGPAVVLGNSFAAGSALWAAREAPQQVRGVALICHLAYMDNIGACRIPSGIKLKPPPLGHSINRGKF